jgi:broad specificity phosphatase PhoE
MAALADVEKGPQPALVVCHGMVIRVAIARRTGKPFSISEPIENTALIELPS